MKLNTAKKSISLASLLMISVTCFASYGNGFDLVRGEAHSPSESIAACDLELNQMIQARETSAAFEKFYDETVEMRENSEPPTLGKAANRVREQHFAKVIVLNGFTLVHSSLTGNTSFSQWIMDYTTKDGIRHLQNQVAVRQWHGCHVTNERFFYTR